MKKLDYITVLRALALLAVLMVHTGQQTFGMEHIHPYLLSVINSGAKGVQLFYMLSAFTLFLSYHHRTAKEERPLANYFVRRFFRIAPLYYLAIVYYLWQDGFGPRYWLGNAQHVSTDNVVSNFLFVNGLSPYWINSVVPGGWSVTVEVTFYCFLPFLFSRIKNIGQAVNFTLFALAFRFILQLFFSHYDPIGDSRLWGDYLFLYFPDQLPVFALGILLYFFIADHGRTTIKPGSYLLLALFFLLGLCVRQELLLPDIFLFALAFLLLTLGLRHYSPAILFNVPIRYIGQISFTLYLTHWAAIYVLNKCHFMNLFPARDEGQALANFFTNFIMILSTAVLMATPLYYLIEMPMQKLGGRIIKIMKPKIVHC